jgi:hypothetical protein
MMDGSTYTVRLRDLETRVDDLKDQIRRSHTRLSLLSDTIMNGGLAGSRADIVFQNEMSSAFRLIEALFVVDGAVQYNRRDDSGALGEQKEIPVYSGSIPPGDHSVQVALTFLGNGYGIFTYLSHYEFKQKSTHSFTAAEGKTLILKIKALERGGVTVPLDQRPAIDWVEQTKPLGPNNSLGTTPPKDPVSKAKAGGEQGK